jgi:hypothetical protein
VTRSMNPPWAPVPDSHNAPSGPALTALGEPGALKKVIGESVESVAELAETEIKGTHTVTAPSTAKQARTRAPRRLSTGPPLVPPQVNYGNGKPGRA